jgi:hypothetical protein
MFNTQTAKPVYNIKLDGVVLAEDKGCPYIGYAKDYSVVPVGSLYQLDGQYQEITGEQYEVIT